MTESLNDTIDLKEELEPQEEFDDIDEILAGGSVSVAQERRHTGWVELALVAIANLIWAVVGLVLWLPQVTRAILSAVLRTTHSALTGQASGRAVASIQRVSRSYVERFLHRHNEQAWVGRRHELRPFRLAGEIGWAATFYLVLLRWIAPERFAPVWRGLVDWAGRAKQVSLAGAAQLKQWAVPESSAFEGVRLQAAGVVFVALFLGMALGFWLGRRGR